MTGPPLSRSLAGYGPGRDGDRAALAQLHGPVRRFDPAHALRLLALRGQVHPRDVAAFLYRDWAAADAWAATCQPGPCLGLAPAPRTGVVMVMDLRPALTSHGIGVTDPAEPDDWLPPPGGSQ